MSKIAKISSRILSTNMMPYTNSSKIARQVKILLPKFKIETTSVIFGSLLEILSKLMSFGKILWQPFSDK
jgi:hypothetical protein